jgi:transcriptional regulator with XRE-family HTH domain
MKGEFNPPGRTLPRLRSPPGLTPAQCRAARALLDWTQQQLADAARVARATVRDFEGGRHHLHRSTEALVVAALDAAGVTLVADPALGEGVFLRAKTSGPQAAPATPRPVIGDDAGPDREHALSKKA